MAITQATSLADFSTGIGTAGAVLQVDNADQRIGIGTTDPQGTLQVGIAITMDGTAGVITASSFSGSGGNLSFTGADISAATASFTGNVSVGGTLTYEDVTNIDAVGVITARSDVSIADKIIHTGDTNTAIRFPAADTFTVETSGSERVRIDSNGRLIIGHTASTGEERYFQIVGTTADTSSAQLIRHSADANASKIDFSKSRNATKGSNTIVQDDDVLGSIEFRGDDGTDLNSAGASISASVDGTPGSNDMPGRLVFATTADGAASPTERLRITSAGDFGYGTSSPGCFFEVSKDDSGATVQQKLLNRSTDANSSSNNFIYVNGAAAGDPFTTWTVGGVTSWSMGIDNSDSDKLVINNGSNLSSNLISVDTSGNVTLNANVDLQDNDYLRIGTGDDLQLYHNAFDSYIDNTATGDLYIRNTADDKDIVLVSDNSSGGTSTYILCDGSSGAVILNHYGTEKFTTTSSGVEITGTLSATGNITQNGNALATNGKAVAMALVFG